MICFSFFAFYETKSESVISIIVFIRLPKRQWKKIYPFDHKRKSIYHTLAEPQYHPLIELQSHRTYACLWFLRRLETYATISTHHMARNPYHSQCESYFHTALNIIVPYTHFLVDFLRIEEEGEKENQFVFGELIWSFLGNNPIKNICRITYL